MKFFQTMFVFFFKQPRYAHTEREKSRLILLHEGTRCGDPEYYITWHVILIADRVHWLSWRRHTYKKKKKREKFRDWTGTRRCLVFSLLRNTWNKHEKVTQGHLYSRPLWFFFFPSSSFFFIIIMMPLVCCCCCSVFFSFFYELLLRSLSDIFSFFWKKKKITIFSGTCKRKNCNRNSHVLFSLLL